MKQNVEPGAGFYQVTKHLNFEIIANVLYPNYVQNTAISLQL